MTFLEGDGNFKWGKVLTRLPDGRKFYDSFIYKGVKYFLNDCVYMLDAQSVETSIGKIVKMSESPTRRKNLWVICFLRPKDVIKYLELKPQWNELFLPCGKGGELFDIVEVGEVLGKCNVICTSEDERNPPASNLDLEQADYYFSSTFNVETRTISKCFPDAIENFKIEEFFNRSRNQHRKPLQIQEVTIDDSAEPVKVSQKPKDVLDKEGSSDVVKVPFNKGATTKKDGSLITLRYCGGVRSTTSVADLPLMICPRHEVEEDMKMAGQQKIKQAKVSAHKEYKGDAPYDSSTSKLKGKLTHETQMKVAKKVMEVTKKPPSDRDLWFCPEPWENRLQPAYEQGKLVFLSNLDPSYTSSEVEDMIWTAFGARTSARVIPRVSHSSPHYGQAFVIFVEQKKGDEFITELMRRSLMQEGGRPVIASRRAPVVKSSSSNTCDFPGHIAIDDHKPKRSCTENAVSTSHSSQSNTLEFDFAMEWRVLQERCAFQWKTFYEKHERDDRELMKQLKHLPWISK